MARYKSQKGTTMTTKQKAYHTALIKNLHISPRYINLYKNDDELYREFLHENFGVKSSKELDIESLKNLVEYMNFKGELKQASKSYKITQNQVNYLLSLWQERSLYKDIYSLLAFCKKIIKKELVSIEDMSKTEAKKMILAVQNMKKIAPVNNTNYQGA